MNALRVLYHLTRADFLERIRRYSSLITLGLALFLGYSIASGQLTLIVGQHYRGMLNSAWVGGLMSAITNFFLGLFGFYLVKGSVSRDYKTGVGQIMAATQLKRPIYTVAKWMSNFAVLGAMVVVLMAVAVVMQTLFREAPVIHWWALLTPFLWLVLPFMAFTAALAVLFETIAGLRGGVGNVLYFFSFIMVVTVLSSAVRLGASPALDLTGMGVLSNSMGQAAQAVFPNYNGSFRITWLIPELQIFRWEGIDWTPEIVLSRLALILFSIGIVALSALFFDRFNPSRIQPHKRKENASGDPKPSSTIEKTPPSNHLLTPLVDTRARFRFGALLSAEMRLLLKRQRWWWYLIAAGLLVAQVFAPLKAVHPLLSVSWLWHLLIISKLGCRETFYNTRQMIFSAPRLLANQLSASWLSAFIVTALLGSGAWVRFVLAGEMFNLLGWLTGAFFIPSLALALGALTGSSKAFEALYVLWMYLLSQKVPAFDFIGFTPASPQSAYVLLSLILLCLAFINRSTMKIKTMR
ncbi:MAG: ABC transporter permease [Bellilinea sp.]|nr:MAG: ABC transporter permease [Bellilinea sp.]